MPPHDDSTSAVGRIVEQHGSAVRSYFRRALGGNALADDLTQDVFLRVLKAAPDFEARGCDRAWLFTVAHNVLVEHLRRAGRRGETPLTNQEPVARPTQTTAAAVREALRRLPDDDRQLFLLAEVAGLTYEEIRQVCGLTHAAVRSRVFRARLALREALAPPDPTDTRALRSADHDDARRT